MDVEPETGDVVTVRLTKPMLDCFADHRVFWSKEGTIILSETGVIPIRMYYTGHVSIRAISSTERVLTMLDLVTRSEDPPSAAPLRQFLLRCRRTSADHLAYFSDAALRSRRRAASPICLNGRSAQRSSRKASQR